MKYKKKKKRKRVTSKHMEIECIISKIEDGKCWILKVNPKEGNERGKR